MKPKMKPYRSIIRKSICSGIILFLTAICIILAQTQPKFMEVYQQASRAYMGAYGKLTSIVPFSIIELLIPIIIILCLVLLFYWIRGFFHKKKDKKLLWFLKGFTTLLLTVSIIACYFTLSWGLNYFAPPLSTSLALDTTNFKADELYQTTKDIIINLNTYDKKINRDKNNIADLGTFTSLSDKTIESYEAISKTYPQWKGIYSPVKKVYNSNFMSAVGISGVFFPFTGESNVNSNDISANFPFIMAHEMSHRLGINPEDEANFTAFLVCKNSPYDEVRYSAYFNAYIYCSNALYEQSPKDWEELRGLLDDGPIADLKANNDLYDQYESPVRDIGNQVNNTYLKVMQQEDGIKSYDMVVNLLIAQWRKEQSR